MGGGYTSGQCSPIPEMGHFADDLREEEGEPELGVGRTATPFIGKIMRFSLSLRTGTQSLDKII